MNKKILILSIAVVAILIIVIFTLGNKTMPFQVSRNGIYCLSDGTFTNDMPIQSHRSYCIKASDEDKQYSANNPGEYSFSIVDDQGNTLNSFAITHTKPMHVIVVRKDLAYFQHLHPDYSQKGNTFTLRDLTFPTDGVYRIFADFAPADGQKDLMGSPLAVTTSTEILVGNVENYTPQPIGTEENLKTFGNYSISLNTHGNLVSGVENMLMFSLSQNGKPVVDLEPYLGALGHSIILREGTLDFIHSHPMEIQNQNGTVSFMVTFPEAGKYKVFAQFQRDGEVFTTDFVVSVAQGSDTSRPIQGADMILPDMDSSSH